MKGALFSSPLHPHSSLTSLGNMPFLSPFLKFLAWAQPGAAGLVPYWIRGGGVSLKESLVSVLSAEEVQKSLNIGRDMEERGAAPTVASVYVWKITGLLSVTWTNLISHQDHSCLPTVSGDILVYGNLELFPSVWVFLVCVCIFLWITPWVLYYFSL